MRLTRLAPMALALTAASFAAVAANGERIVDIRIVDGAVLTDAAQTAGGVPVLRVTRGETVALRWSSDEALTVHLHGYDIETAVPTGAVATMRLLARAAGRFPIERHGRADHKVLLYLEVRPD